MKSLATFLTLALLAGGCKGRAPAPSESENPGMTQTERCAAQTPVEEVFKSSASLGGESVGYASCLALSGGGEAACGALPAKVPASNALFAPGSNPKKQCADAYDRMGFLKALSAGAPREELSERARRFFAADPEFSKIDFKAVGEDLQAWQKSGEARGALDKDYFRFLKGKEGCSALGDKGRKFSCLSDAAALSAVKAKDAGLCDEKDRGACEALLGGKSVCETLKTALLSSYCMRKTSVAQNGPGPSASKNP